MRLFLLPAAPCGRNRPGAGRRRAFWGRLTKLPIRLIFSLFTGLGLTAGLSSCATVAPYQRQYLNDEDMQLANRRLEAYETNFESYREGVGGANGGKVGGGCGCN